MVNYVYASRIHTASQLPCWLRIVTYARTLTTALESLQSSDLLSRHRRENSKQRCHGRTRNCSVRHEKHVIEMRQKPKKLLSLSTQFKLIKCVVRSKFKINQPGNNAVTPQEPRLLIPGQKSQAPLLPCVTKKRTKHTVQALSKCVIRSKFINKPTRQQRRVTPQEPRLLIPGQESQEPLLPCVTKKRTKHTVQALSKMRYPIKVYK